MHIKKKLIAISAVIAMMLSFSACSDKGDSSSGSSAANNIPDVKETLSSEEIDQLTKHSLSIEPFIPDTGVQQDEFEDDSNSDNNNADNNSSIDNNANNNNNSNNNNNNNNNNSPGSNTVSPDKPNGVTIGNTGSNNVDIPQKTGLQVITGTKAVMKASWMDLSEYKDHIFNGEYLTAEFKIKEDAVDGIYPITLDWLDFPNWDAEDVKFTGIDGAVIVGGDAEENKFNDNSDPQIMVSNVSGKAGDTVKVSFNVKNNPGVVANVLIFGFNGDALEYVSGGEGADFDGQFQ